MRSLGQLTSDAAFERAAAKVDLPPRIFLYTLDQVAYCVEMSVESLRRAHVHFAGRTTGYSPRGLILARNIAEPKDKPDWRVTEGELVRWLKFKGFVFSESSRLIR